MATLTRIPSASDGQLKQINRVAADAAEKAINEFGLNKDQAQRVHGSAEFAARIRAAVTTVLTDVAITDRYKDEEVESTYGYLSGYKPKPFMEQVAILQQHFPNLSHTDLSGFDIPDGAEDTFAIPRFEKIAPTYGQAVEIVLGLIGQTRGFYNYRKGQTGPTYLRQSERKLAALEAIGEKQEGDILVIPAQFGIRHRGRSVRRAREVFDGDEFGLGAFEVSIMLLTHPERLQHYDDLWIDCAGDEFAPGADGGFSDAPFFYFYGVKVKFFAYWIDYAYEYYGSASGFVPQ
ncbi:MAG TPA: hypothetical protein VGB97_02100 [Candidatus Paceibacterota bacterium]|jgi:hypothetical protein